MGFSIISDTASLPQALLLLSGLNSRFYRAACNATHSIAVAILSVRLSVRLSDACIVTKTNDALQIF